MASLRLPVMLPKGSTQRFSCRGCGECCRNLAVELREADLEALRAHGWRERMGEYLVERRGRVFLKQRDDGACVFLTDDGRCRIHAERGAEAKPLACRLYPFTLLPSREGAAAAVSFACPTVAGNQGEPLAEHRRDLTRVARAIPELAGPAMPPRLDDAARATKREERAAVERLDVWLARSDLDLVTRLNGFAWVVDALARATLENVRDERFDDLLDVLVGALPEELPHHPVATPTSRHMKLLRQASYVRLESPTLARILARGRWRTSVGQYLASRRFARGRGETTDLGPGFHAGVSLAGVESIGPARGEEASAVEDLVTRWLRAALWGGRMWGTGFYGWSIVRGLQAWTLNAAAAGWLMRLHARGAGRDEIAFDDARAAIGRVDRTAGRAPWLGSAAERLRLTYLAREDGLRALLLATAPVAAPSGGDGQPDGGRS